MMVPLSSNTGGARLVEPMPPDPSNATQVQNDPGQCVTPPKKNAIECPIPSDGTQSSTTPPTSTEEPSPKPEEADTSPQTFGRVADLGAPSRSCVEPVADRRTEQCNGAIGQPSHGPAAPWRGQGAGFVSLGARSAPDKSQCIRQIGFQYPWFWIACPTTHNGPDPRPRSVKQSRPSQSPSRR